MNVYVIRSGHSISSNQGPMYEIDPIVMSGGKFMVWKDMHIETNLKAGGRNLPAVFPYHRQEQPHPIQVLKGGLDFIDEYVRPADFSLDQSLAVHDISLPVSSLPLPMSNPGLESDNSKGQEPDNSSGVVGMLRSARWGIVILVGGIGLFEWLGYSQKKNDKKRT